MKLTSHRHSHSGKDLMIKILLHVTVYKYTYMYYRHKDSYHIPLRTMYRMKNLVIFESVIFLSQSSYLKRFLLKLSSKQK